MVLEGHVWGLEYRVERVGFRVCGFMGCSGFRVGVFARERVVGGWRVLGWLGLYRFPWGQGGRL